MRKNRSRSNDMEPLFTDEMEGWNDSLPEVENCLDDNVPERTESGDSSNSQGDMADHENREGNDDEKAEKQEGAPVYRDEKYWSELAREGSNKIVLPDVISMTKYFCDHHRLDLYSYLNRCLRDGSLAKIVGFSFQDRWLNKKSCEFKQFSYWRVDRETFYMDITVHLSLKTTRGISNWYGTLVVWCSFPDEDEEEAADSSGSAEERSSSGNFEFLPKDGFYFDIERLVSGRMERHGLIGLSPFLVPYYRNRDLDKQTEDYWLKRIPDALYDYTKRNAYALANQMGLQVVCFPLYRHEGVASILFFQDDQLEVLERNTPPGGPHRSIRIPARTIVINENLKQHNYPQFDIFHECIHYEEHYLFYRLQGLRCNDSALLKTIEVPVEESSEPAPDSSDSGAAQEVHAEQHSGEGDPADVSGKDNREKEKKTWKDPVYFMEKQANRGALGLMLPAGPTHEMIYYECERARKAVVTEKGRPYRHNGELYEDVGIQLSLKLHIPHFRIRARLIQLGYMEARGSLNYANKKLIQPFAFDKEAWREMTHTFVVDRDKIQDMETKSPEFSKVMESGEYVYADGHIVKNGDRYVREVIDQREGIRLVLTDWANRHVDQCCLRFVRVFVQRGVGKYEFGRMYYDAEFVARTKFYVNDFLNREKLGDMDDVEARMLYRDRFPKSFADAFQYLRIANGITMNEFAEKLGMNHVTLKRWVETPLKYRNEDFLTAVCLILRLPDWISRLLFKRAAFVLDDDNPRHMALDYILRVQSCDGIKAANDYLTRHGFKKLTN